MYTWCKTKQSGGYVNYSSAHRFIPYETLILRRPMYYCECGKKCTPEEYIEYSKYLIARDMATRNYHAKKIRNHY